MGTFVLFGEEFVLGQAGLLAVRALSALAYEKTGLAPFIAADQEGAR